MPRPSRRSVLGIGIPIAVIALLVAAWAIDTGGAGGRVQRNVRLAGRDVGNLAEDQLTNVVHQVAEDFASTPIQIRSAGHTYRTTAGEAGLVIDEPATVHDALGVGRTDGFWLRPVQWLASFAQPRTAPIRYTIRADELTQDLASLEGSDGRIAVEPSLVGSPDTVGIRGGTSGFALDPTEVGVKLVAAAEAGRQPLSVSADPVEHRPQVSDDKARKLAGELTLKTAKPFTVTAGDDEIEVPVGTVRGWIGSKVVGTVLQPTVDERKVITDLKALLPEQASEVKDATITLTNGVPTVVPSESSAVCCAAGTGGKVLAAIVGGLFAVDVPLITKDPEFTTADAKALGIKEPVGTVTEWKGIAQVKSFTTYHQCCQSRVTNIHRIADLIRGTIVKPGERFSVNDTVGERTEAKGFVVAGAIADGEHVDQVGGGVSQFATTMFNAAFFAGLPFGEYQAHSEHFDRYPYGREATMGFEHPDLQWKNDTPYGIMVWTSYTDTSVTVTLYSTQYAYGEQSGQTSSHSGNCTSVRTTRTIHYVDGRTATDTVGARYRDPGATRC